MSEKIADELHAFIAAAPHKYPGHLIELFDRAEKALRCCSADSAPQVSIMPMGLSDGRTDYYVQIKVGDRVVTPHVFREEYKAAYHVALYDWLLNGAGEEPDCIEFGPKEWPARVIPARAEPQAARELAQEDMMRASDATALLDYLPSFADIKPRTWDDLFDLLREHGGIGFARKWIERLSEIRTILDAKRTITRAEPQSLPLRGPDCACCEQRPRKDCTVPGCTMKDAGWALERSQAESVLVPKPALDWLFGVGPGPDGKSFDDDQDAEERTPRKYSRRYWWRSKFSSMIPALTRPPHNRVEKTNGSQS
jgi:hypothetical protein